MEHKENNFLEQEPVGKLMMKYAVPCIISRKWADPVDTFWRVLPASARKPSWNAAGIGANGVAAIAPNKKPLSCSQLPSNSSRRRPSPTPASCR